MPFNFENGEPSYAAMLECTVIVKSRDELKLSTGKLICSFFNVFKGWKDA